jgi:hypothetical protein
LRAHDAVEAGLGEGVQVAQRDKIGGVGLQSVGEEECLGEALGRVHD